MLGKAEERIPLGRPRRRWVDNIRMDLQKVGCGYMDWIGLAQNRQVEDACDSGNEPSGSVKCGEFLDYLQTSYLLKKVSAPWSK